MLTIQSPYTHRIMVFKAACLDMALFTWCYHQQTTSERQNNPLSKSLAVAYTFQQYSWCSEGKINTLCWWNGKERRKLYFEIILKWTFKSNFKRLEGNILFSAWEQDTVAHTVLFRSGQQELSRGCVATFTPQESGCISVAGSVLVNHMEMKGLG